LLILNDTFCLAVRRAGFATAFVAALAFAGTRMVAQSSVPSGTVSEALLTLPDEPGGLSVSSSADASALEGQGASGSAKTAATATGATLPEASRYQWTIEPGQGAPALTAGDKVVGGLKDSFSLFAALGWFASAGWEQLTNGSPNYGTDRGAFGERLGVAAIRDSSESIFSDCVMAPLLHEDPRYYRMGSGHNFVVRAIYAGTRTIITKTDGGKTTPNFALLTGTLGGSALTNVYYPQINTGAKQVFLTFGGSLGGTAVGNLVTEFYKDIFHSRHK
jgi:hypothetical protein